MDEDNTNNIEDKLSVSDLIHNFRSGLIALIPIFEKMGIGWHDEEQSEEFDGIAESLYKWIVIAKLENYINDNYGFIPSFSNYSFHYKDYAKLCFISIDSEIEENEEYFVFVSFKSYEWAFDTIICNKIGKNGAIIEKDLELSFEDANFLLKLKLPDGNVKSLECF